MPISNIDEFTDSTQFERLVLDRLIPIFPSHSGDEIDLRRAMAGAGPVEIRTSASFSLSGQATSELIEGILPLLFGAAWKVLDLLVELLLQKGREPLPAGNWTIKAKLAALDKGDVDWLALGGDQAIWGALASLYAATTEHRHCLVHRLAHFAEGSLTLSGEDRQGNPLRDLRAEELQAFIRAVQVAARAITNGGLQSREADHLRYELDKLCSHTGRGSLGGAKAGCPEVVRMLLLPKGSVHMADFAYVCSNARKRSPGGGHFDLWIDIPDDPSRQLFARMEDVPPEKVIVSLANLPAYLSWR